MVRREEIYLFSSGKNFIVKHFYTVLQISSSITINLQKQELKSLNLQYLKFKKMRIWHNFIFALICQTLHSLY